MRTELTAPEPTISPDFPATERSAGNQRLRSRPICRCYLVIATDSSLETLVRRLHGVLYLLALVVVAVLGPLIGARAWPTVAMLGTVTILSRTTRSMSVLLASDLAVAVGLWWLFGPISGANFIPYVVVSLGPLMLTEQRARRILWCAILTIVASGGLHLLATRFQLPLFHPPGPIPDGEFFAGLAIQGILLVAVGALMVKIATTLRAGRRALETDLERQKELHKLKDEFLATVSHQLRTPLTALRGFSAVMLGDEITQDEHREYLHLVVSQAEVMHTLLEDVFTFSRIETGELIIRAEPVRAAQLIGATIDGMGPSAEAVSIHVDNDILVLADPSRLAQMVRNLVDNAIKYGAPPVRVVGRSDGDDFQCVVFDGGVGLAPDDRTAAFDPYTRLVDNPTMSDPGLGLGLTIVRELAERQGGSARYGETDRGFEFRLPLAQQHRARDLPQPATGLASA